MLVAAKASRRAPEGGFLRLLRAVALIATVVGGIGSVVFLLRAGRRNESLILLVILFTIWVLSPFIALLWANRVSKRWSVVTRTTLYCVTLAVALSSLVIYSGVVDLRPAGSPNVFLFVAVPPASWAFIAIVVGMAALISRKRGA